MQSPSWRQERRSLWKLRIFDGREGPLTAARALENVLSFVTVRVMFRVAKFSASFPGRGASFPVTVRPTRADVSIAQSIARNTAPAPEQVARALTWGADEKVLLILAAAGWLASRGCSEPLQRAGNHALLLTVAASLLPHGLKRLFDQTRPNRLSSATSIASRFPANVRMPFLPAMRCIREPWHRPPVACRLCLAGRSA
jgi:hypothetical protein